MALRKDRKTIELRVGDTVRWPPYRADLTVTHIDREGQFYLKDEKRGIEYNMVHRRYLNFIRSPHSL